MVERVCHNQHRPAPDSFGFGASVSEFNGSNYGHFWRDPEGECAIPATVSEVPKASPQDGHDRPAPDGFGYKIMNNGSNSGHFWRGHEGESARRPARPRF